MPYQFEAYHNPFALSIAQLLERRGDIGAQQAIAIGNAQARAQEANGQIWGQAIGQIGQQLGQIPGQIQAAKDADQRRQLVGNQVQQSNIALAGQQQQQAGGRAVDAMMAGDQLPQDAAGPRQQSYLDDRGLFDIQKITASLNQGGFGHIAPDLVQKAESINDSLTKHAQLTQKLAEQKTVVLGDLADGVLGVIKNGTPIDRAMDLVAAPALATKTIDPQQYAQVRQQLLSLPPEQQQAYLGLMRDQAAKIAPTKVIGKDATETDRYGRTLVSNIVPEKPTEASLAADLSSPDPAVRARAQTAMAALKPTPNRTAEQDDARYRDIQAKLTLKQSISPEDMAWAGGYEKQKTLNVDKSAAAASTRLAAVQAQQNALQSRAQSFTEAQSGRKELTDKVEMPYLDAVEKAETLRSVIGAAQAGNREAAAVTPLLATLGLTTSEGVKRINMSEIATVQGAGSLFDSIKGRLGKYTAGQPLDAKLQDDIVKLADLMEGSARKKYEQGFQTITQRYGLKDETIRPVPSVTPTTSGTSLTPGLQNLLKR